MRGSPALPACVLPPSFLGYPPPAKLGAFPLPRPPPPFPHPLPSGSKARAPLGSLLLPAEA